MSAGTVMGEFRVLVDAGLVEGASPREAARRAFNLLIERRAPWRVNTIDGADHRTVIDLGPYEPGPFGGWSIDLELYEYLIRSLEPDSVVVELGSGRATPHLARNFRLYSVEHDPEWAGRYDNTFYIHAPIVDGWYSTAELEQGLPKSQDLILVDGPIVSRLGFLRHLNLFDKTATIVVDDCHRRLEMGMAVRLGEILGREVQVTRTARKAFAVLEGSPDVPVQEREDPTLVDDTPNFPNGTGGPAPTPLPTHSNLVEATKDMEGVVRGIHEFDKAAHGDDE